jgi:hypothetical protein
LARASTVVRRAQRAGCLSVLAPDNFDVVRVEVRAS